MKMTKLVKSLLVFTTAIILSVTMGVVPGMSEYAHAVTSEDSEITYEDLEGENIDDLRSNSETEDFVEDPEMYRYFDVDDNGNLHEKEVELDEVDEFIQKMDENAEGIDDTQLSEMSDNMYCVGCGISGLGKAEVPKKYRKYKRYNCLDISWWQGNISQSSWNKIKAAGVTHVIIRTGYTSLRGFNLNVDSRFGTNINRAYKAGLKIGVYHFSQATSVSEAQKEANYTIKLLKNYKKKIVLPVVLDYETNSAGRLNMSKLKSLARNGTSTKICEAFCKKIKDAGYKPMIYANYTTLKSYLDYEKLQKNYRIWLANYTTNGKATTYPGAYWMWQYSSSGRVNGISGAVDMNYIFFNGQGGAPLKYKSSSSSTTSSTAKSSTKTSTKTSTTKTTTKKTTTSSSSKPKFVSYKAKTTAKLAYRTGPGTKYKKKGAYKKGATVTVVGKSGSWSKLNNGYYVSSKFLKKITTGTTSYKAKTTAKLNYRTGPGTKYKKKGTYKKGATVTVVGKSGSWSKLSSGYYVSSKYLKKISTSYKVKTTAKLAYRTGPGSNYKRVGALSKGKVVTIVSEKNGWGKLSSGYYVYLKYTKKI